MSEGIVQVQFLNYLLNNNTIDPVLEYQLTEEYFPGYEAEFNSIINYFNDSRLLDGKGQVPDKVKFAYDFPDFNMFETGTAINTMFKELHEQRCYALYVQAIQKGAELSKTSSFDAIQFTKIEIDKLTLVANQLMGSGKDIVKQAGERLEDYIKRIEAHGLMGIPTGLKNLDKELHGWLPEDLILVIARTNEGKSWLLLFFAIQAWLAGKKVGVYSGEMSSLMYGYRFDTMFRHFKNSGLISGDINLGSSEDSTIGVKSINEYRDHIADLINGNHPTFKIYTQKDFGGPMSVSKMRVIQEKEKFEFWGLDQLSLMTDDKKGRDLRFRYANISSDLFAFTEDYQIPILLLHQANRKAAESKKKDVNATPELEDSQDADAIAQNSTRVLSFTQIENGAKISNKKNRYGKRGQEFLTTWNIDYGILKELSTESIKDNLF